MRQKVNLNAAIIQHLERILVLTKMRKKNLGTKLIHSEIYENDLIDRISDRVVWNDPQKLDSIIRDNSGT